MQLKKYLYENVPGYMVPSFIIHLDQLPRMISGKVNKRKLKDIVIRREIEKPRDDMQAAMAELWKKVLDIDEVGITDSFFEVGGDSIKSIILINMINEQFGTSYGVQDLFQYINIEMLCNKIKEDNSVQETQDIEEIDF